MNYIIGFILGAIILFVVFLDAEDPTEDPKGDE